MGTLVYSQGDPINPSYLEFPKEEWHDLKSAHQIDITKMVILLLTQEYALLNIVFMSLN